MACWQCNGSGFVQEEGEKVTWESLSDREKAEVLLHGGHYRRKGIWVVCPKCEGTGRGRWTRWRERMGR